MAASHSGCRISTAILLIIHNKTFIFSTTDRNAGNNVNNLFNNTPTDERNLEIAARDDHISETGRTGS